jgi:hypothetical protein
MLSISRTQYSHIFSIRFKWSFYRICISFIGSRCILLIHPNHIFRMESEDCLKDSFVSSRIIGKVRTIHFPNRNYCTNSGLLPPYQRERYFHFFLINVEFPYILTWYFTCLSYASSSCSFLLFFSRFQIIYLVIVSLDVLSSTGKFRP